MLGRLISFLLILISMCLFSRLQIFNVPSSIPPTLVLGFMLLAAYCVGYFFNKMKLPWITGYIVAGLFLGPYFLKFYSQDSVMALGFLNNLALAFIAFCAGGELKIQNLLKKLKSIIILISGVTIVVFLGVTLTVFAISSIIKFMSGYNPIIRLAISAIFGVIAVARSPSSAIAIISETKAKGEYTNLVLSVTIVMDVIIIILFAVIISVCQLALAGGGSVDPNFLLTLVFQIAVALILGFFLGKGVIFLINKVQVEFPVVIIAMGFLVIKFCHLFGEYLHQSHEISLNLEPLLICMVAGFTVQNFSKHGATFLEGMDRVSFPIYVAFFTITGASINFNILKAGWFLGFIVVIVRTIMIYFGCYISGKFSGDKPEIYKNTWLGFITQAGLSLGLLSEVARRFPEFGTPIQSILIAAITLNQIIGPVTFKYGLHKLGETNQN